MMKDFKAIDHYPKKKRSKPAYVTKENQFMSDANDLFDIFCKDSSQRRELEEKFLLRMTQKDHEFYEDQKGPRNAKCLSSIDPLTSSDYRFQRRVQEKQHESCVSYLMNLVQAVQILKWYLLTVTTRLYHPNHLLQHFSAYHNLASKIVQIGPIWLKLQKGSKYLTEQLLHLQMPC